MRSSVPIVLMAIFFGSMQFASAQTYFVKRVPGNKMKITGKGDSPDWNKANQLTDFSFPWEVEKAPVTSFAALWDGDWLYCLYQVKDDSVITLVNKNDKLEVGACDRVEIFMTPDSTMTPYYCLEMDATGRVLDYRASYYRKMDYSWKWPNEQLIIKTSAIKDGYIVEVAISIQSLKELGLLRNNRILAGLFRAERNNLREGKAGLRWISWLKPNSAKPDFHIPSAFGVLVLE
ncbi:endoxylanase [Niastella caeni]|uniref:Endoxylanase n=1 Tax=Niastella caeni TaxID=2569763 RepID=A0A4S8HRC8_9BACT|nr:carbohydrate-binding family 9-like protein [Niastella caeni]THU37089.1 endoxylanase [Niastella caeni]